MTFVIIIDIIQLIDIFHWCIRNYVSVINKYGLHVKIFESNRDINFHRKRSDLNL